MGRPKIDRIVRNLPGANFFAPQPFRMGYLNLDIENLTIVEFEALRLKHYEGKDQTGLNQIECAKKMGVSQSTFSRILEEAHNKIARALVEGKAIHLEGGNYGFKKLFLGYGCAECLHEWELEVKDKVKILAEEISDEKLKEILPLSSEITCPNCHSKSIFRLKKDIVLKSK